MAEPSQGIKQVGCPPGHRSVTQSVNKEDETYGGSDRSEHLRYIPPRESSSRAFFQNENIPVIQFWIRSTHEDIFDLFLENRLVSSTRSEELQDKRRFLVGSIGRQPGGRYDAREL
jgi:hypothetical protein